MTDYFAHESACVDEPTEIGEGTKIWHFCHVMTGATIGRNCVLGQNTHVATGAKETSHEIGADEARAAG